MQEVRVGVGVAVLTKNGYVLLQRKGSHGAGEWSFPGGHLEFGETVIQCAIRETFEETGLILENASIIPIFTEDFFPEKQYITLYVHGSADGNPLILEPNKATNMIQIEPSQTIPTPIFSGVEKIWDWITQYHRY
jgi:8-oxo-dGTP diphosphatase